MGRPKDGPFLLDGGMSRKGPSAPVTTSREAAWRPCRRDAAVLGISKQRFDILHSECKDIFGVVSGVPFVSASALNLISFVSHFGGIYRGKQL
jgi:hypothetical protein